MESPSDPLAVELHGQVQGPILEVPRFFVRRKRKVEEGRRGATRRLAELKSFVAKVVVVVVQLFAVDVAAVRFRVLLDDLTK
jgi:hypothetical protein